MISLAGNLRSRPATFFFRHSQGPMGRGRRFQRGAFLPAQGRGKSSLAVSADHPFRMIATVLVPNSRILDFKEIGRVTFRRHAYSRRVAIHVRPFEGVVVVYPRRVSLATAARVVDSTSDWILSRLAEARRSEERLLRLAAEGGRVARHHAMRIVETECKAVSLSVSGGEIILRYPRGSEPDGPLIRRALWKGVIAACRTEAKDYLPDRVAALAQVHGFHCSGVVLKNLRSRWGSCSSGGNINLNLRLMQLPDRLIDYVILHELVHTRIRHHGVEFWNMLESILPEARRLNAELNSHRCVP